MAPECCIKEISCSSKCCTIPQKKDNVTFWLLLIDIIKNTNTYRSLFAIPSRKFFSFYAISLKLVLKHRNSNLQSQHEISIFLSLHTKLFLRSQFDVIAFLFKEKIIIYASYLVEKVISKGFYFWLLLLWWNINEYNTVYVSMQYFLLKIRF